MASSSWASLADRAFLALSTFSAKVRLDHLQVQFDKLFNAFECFGGQTEQGFQIGFLCGCNLFRGQDHCWSPVVNFKVKQNRN